MWRPTRDSGARACGHSSASARQVTVPSACGRSFLLNSGPSASLANRPGKIPATALNSPRTVAVGTDGTVYVADTGNSRIRKIDTGGRIRPVLFASKDPDPSGVEMALLARAVGLAVAGGRIYLAVPEHSRIVMIDAEGLESVVAGTGMSGLSADGAPATRSPLNGPTSLQVGADGVVYIGDTGNARIRRVGTDGKITTVVVLGPKKSFEVSVRPLLLHTGRAA
ncbi:hypothetical protein [Frankia tisae]|uniref:hypothetical protein n=1 Tax=Frankia tisae TaxID=2950104 RepID=UPI0021BFAD35|nr:hypothetical protein [Frankia tisae]